MLNPTENCREKTPLVCPYSDSESLLRGSSSFVGMACVIIIRSWDVGSEAHALCRLLEKHRLSLDDKCDLVTKF